MNKTIKFVDCVPEYRKKHYREKPPEMSNRQLNEMLETIWCVDAIKHVSRPKFNYKGVELPC